MNILKNEVNTNININQSYMPTLTDIGAAVVFGLGFYFFKIHLSKKPEETEAVQNEKPQKDPYLPIREKINNALTKWESQISIQKINCIIKKEIEQENFDPFMILDQIQTNGVNPDISTINTLLDTCTKLGDFANFNRLCELIIDSENSLSSNMPQANIVTFNIILKGLNTDMCKMEFEDRKKFYAPAKVEFILKEISRRNLKVNDITMNSIIDIMVESGNFSLAWRYFEELDTEFNVEPDIYTYSTLLKSIKNYNPEEENIDKAFEILKLVKLSKAKGVLPDEIFYNCILETCVKYNRMYEGELVFMDMKEALVTPSQVTYGIMIKGFGSVPNIEKSFGLFYEMKQFNLEPNEIIYGSLLNACVKANNIYKACEFFNEIQNHKTIKMNIYLYSMLIKGYTRSKNFEKAFEIYNQFLQDDSINPSIIAYNAILDCCVECFDIDMMKKIYEELREKASSGENYPQPDLITYSTVIKGFAKIKESSKGLDIYYYLSEREDVKLDEIIFCSVIDCLIKTNRFEEAISVHKNLNDSRIVKTNASYSILIKLYSKLNQVETAVEIYNDMISEKITPSLITYTSILQILIKTKRVINAIQIFEEILVNKIKPDQVLFNVIINGCVLNGKLEEACKFIFESFKDEIRVCDDVYYNILSNLVGNKTMNYAYRNELIFKICQEMTFRGLEIEYKLYNKILRILNKKENNNNEFAIDNFNDDEIRYGNYENSHYKGRGNKGFNNNNNNYRNNKRDYHNNYNQHQEYEFNNNESSVDFGEEKSIYDFVEKKVNINCNVYDEVSYFDRNNNNNNYQKGNYHNNKKNHNQNKKNGNNNNNNPQNYEKSYNNNNVYKNKYQQKQYEFEFDY